MQVKKIAGDTLRPRLLIVDAICAYTDPHSPLFLRHACEALDRICAIRNFLRGRGLPVLLTRIEVSNGVEGALHSSFQKLLVPDGGYPNSALAQYADRTLAPEPSIDCEGNFESQEFLKHSLSAFASNELVSVLRTCRCNAVFIVGFTTGGAIRATALDAVHHGFHAFVVIEGVADQSREKSRAHLEEMKTHGVEVISMAQGKELYHATCSVDSV